MKTSILVSLVILFSTSVYAQCPTADLTGDCRVDLADFALIASQWLTEGIPVDPENIIWVYIDDLGTGMEDPYGNPINHGGFTGEMSKYETTNAQYSQFLNSALADGLIVVHEGSVYAATDTTYSEVLFDTSAADSKSQIKYAEGIFSVRTIKDIDVAHHPVVTVSWFGATAFCEYYGYRLPTEWEWQAVADFDGSYIYGCGLTIDQTMANFDYANPLGLPTNAARTTPVGYYPAYGYGLCDMAGNVWEWTNSSYKDQDTNRVSRGGDWVSGGAGGYGCKVSRRSWIGPSYTGGGHGFRVCR